MTLRAVFMGTPDFAVPSLERLASAGHELLVVTQPAKPAGRGRRLRPSPVRARAEELGLTVVERATLKGEGAAAPLVEFRPDIIVVVAFGLILGRRLLELPRLMPINLHPSRLPRFRGVAPIPWTIWLGDRETAVTTIHMDTGVDTGDILIEERVQVRPRESAAELGARLAGLGAELVLRTVRAVGERRVTPRPQPDAGACYAPRLVKAHGHLDWSRSANELDRQIRATTPWPRARARCGGAGVGILRAEPLSGTAGAPPGTVTDLDGEAIVVATGAGALRLLEVQPAGKRAMSGAAFARGRRLRAGGRLDGLPVPDDLPWPRGVSGARP